MPERIKLTSDDIQGGYTPDGISEYATGDFAIYIKSDSLEAAEQLKQQILDDTVKANNFIATNCAKIPLLAIITALFGRQRPATTFNEVKAAMFNVVWPKRLFGPLYR